MIALALALQLLASDPDSASGSGPTPPAMGVSRFVQLGSVTGIPADSHLREEFLSAFRGMFALGEVPGERRSAGDEWKNGLELPNHFRLLEGSPADDVWTLDVIVGSPPPMRTPGSGGRKSHPVPTRRMSRGMIVAFLVHVVDPNGGPARMVSSRFAFSFPPHGATPGDLAVPQTGYAFPWDQAGSVAGMLALEALHRASGDIVEAERMDIQPAVRSEAGR